MMTFGSVGLAATAVTRGAPPGAIVTVGVVVTVPAVAVTVGVLVMVAVGGVVVGVMVEVTVGVGSCAPDALGTVPHGVVRATTSSKARIWAKVIRISYAPFRVLAPGGCRASYVWPPSIIVWNAAEWRR
jgi:hypothetical protein